MASVQISDIYNPLLWAQAAQEAATEQNRFIQSGIAVSNSLLDSLASQPGNIHELPFFQGLSNTEPNYSSDNPAVTSTAANISSAKQIARSCFENKSWSTMDLAVEISSADPVAAITNRIGKYWAVSDEKRIINSLKGIQADNVANDSGDMVNDIASESIAGQSASTRISADAVIDTLQTAGDVGDFSAMAMHSVQYRELQKQNLIDFIPDSQGVVNIPTYMGMTVVVDDALAPRAGTTDGSVYQVFFFNPGAIVYGVGMPKVPSELERNPDAGNGGGEEIVYSRQTKLWHPQGFQFTSSSVAGNSATYAELATAANWDRVVARKNVGIAILECN